MITTGYPILDYSIFIVAVMLAAIIIARLMHYFLGKFLDRSSSQLQVEATSFRFLKNAVSLIIVVAAAIIVFNTIPALRQFGLTLFAGAGIFAAIVGFASQAAFSNIVSGIFIVIFKPFRVGDSVKISNTYFGTVEDINLRHTTIRDIENKRFIIPNSVISAEVIHNYLITDAKVSNQIYFGIGYDTNIDQAIAIIQEEAEKHPNFIDNRSEEDIAAGLPKVRVRVMAWAESSIQLRATVWSADPALGFDLKCDLLKSVKERFDAAAIEIPFPHRTVVFKGQPPSE